MNRLWHMSEHADDAYDIEVLKLLRTQGLEQHKTTPPFDPRAPVMISLGLALSENAAEGFRERGYSFVMRDNSENSVDYIDEDLYCWLLDRQNVIFATLLGVAACYLDQCGKSSTHLLAPMVMHSSSASVSDAQIKKRLKDMEAHERTHAIARAQLVAADAFVDEDQMLAAEVRLTIAIQQLSKLALPDFSLLVRAAEKLAGVVRPPTANGAAKEIDGALALGDWPVDLQKAMKEAQKKIQALIPAPIECRKCSFCGHEKQRSEFTKNQWLKGKRRCHTCQGSDITMTPGQLAEAAEQAAGNAAMARLYEEQMRKQRMRVDAECKRRNEGAPSDNECIVCWEKWGGAFPLTYRAALPCGHQLCASCLFSPLLTPCRCPICREDITSAKQATCEAVAKADPTLLSLTRELPLISASLQNEILVNLLQACKFRRDDHFDWRAAVEERLIGMVVATPDVQLAATTPEEADPDLTTRQKQQVYLEARRPVLARRRSLQKAITEGETQEVLEQLTEQLKRADENAAADIFAQLNTRGLRMGERVGNDGREEIWQDFHGLHVDEVKAKLAELLDDVLPAVGTLVVITGRGAHSQNGSSRLKRSVEKEVFRRQASVEYLPVPQNPGALRLLAKTRA